MTKTSATFRRHIDRAFEHADAAFERANEAFAEADKAFANAPEGEHFKTDTKNAVEHTLRFTAGSFSERFRLARKFFGIGFSLIFAGCGNLKFRKRK